MEVAKKKLLFLLFLFAIPLACLPESKTKNLNSPEAMQDLNLLSEHFLLAVLKKQDPAAFQKQLMEIDPEDLPKRLTTDAQKLAFWINIYNSYIILSLREHPEYYDPAVRSDFFKKPLIQVAGKQLSFAEVEHGLVRKSQWEYGLGYFRTWLPGKFERQNRVEQQDYRIHFALNCGAKDCPPVAVYSPKTLDRQFAEQTKAYLTKTTVYEAEKNTAKVTALFSWFRGDFGGKSGIRKILKQHELVPADSRVSLSYLNYDWTLDLENYILPK